MTTWMAIAVGLAVVMFGVGAFARVMAAKARQRAPRKLAQVRAALARRLPDQARRLLPGAFYMPISGRYSPHDAVIALEVLGAFEDTMASYRLSAAIITQDLRDALERCLKVGTPVSWRLISSFVRVLWAVAPKGAPLLKIIREESERAAQEEGEAWDDEEPQPARFIPDALAPARSARM